jgi:hypothetical protein
MTEVKKIERETQNRLKLEKEVLQTRLDFLEANKLKEFQSLKKICNKLVWKKIQETALAQEIYREKQELKATIDGKECQTYRLFSDRRTLNEIHEKAVLKEENLIQNFEIKVFNIKRGIEKLLQEKDEIDTKLKSGVIKCNKLIEEIREINSEINKS